MESLDKFREINASFPYNDSIKKWKDEGKKVAGWLCIYVPEELIHAAGMLPIRVTVNDEKPSLEKAGVIVAETTCSYIRCCFELGLEGKFDYLDGIAVSACCQGCLRLSEVWQYYIKQTPIIYTLDLPRYISEEVVQFYKLEVLEFKSELERQYNVKITDEALRKSIKLYNESRVLLKELYETRKSDDPPITGAEALEVVNASHRMPKEEFNPLLKKLLQEIKGRKAYPPGERTRVMLLGSPLNSDSFLRDVEGLGFSVVTDEICMGAKYFDSDLVDESPGVDPIDAISRRYIFQFPCPREMPKEIRLDKIEQLAKDYKVQGAIPYSSGTATMLSGANHL